MQSGNEGKERRATLNGLDCGERTGEVDLKRWCWKQATAAIIGSVLLALTELADSPANAAGDPEHGQRLFRACVACHTLERGRHRTGPSLAGIWGREAGTVEGFIRYSPALKAADLVWTEETLDHWLADPRALVPGNRMTFPGVKDPEARADLIAFLKAGPSAKGAAQAAQGGGMMRAPALQDLKALGPDQQVASIRYCGDTYHVTTAAEETLPFWEFNLRFKTDSSAKGPAQGRPALLRAGMMGDRAFVVFANPAEVSSFIEVRC